MIKGKIKGISSEYCRRLEQSGANVQSEDESGIKMRNRYFSCSTQLSFKNTFDECIQQCVQQKDCQAASYNKFGYFLFRKDMFYCNTCNHNSLQIAFPYSNGTTSYLDPSSLGGELGLQELRYDLSVPSVNALLITGSSDFETLNSFCALACSYDETCVGFEVSVNTIYKHNCQCTENIVRILYQRLNMISKPISCLV